MRAYSPSNWKHTGVVLLCLLPGLGLIILLIGTVISMAVAQSVGYFNFSGPSEFSLIYWQKQLASPFLHRSVLYSAKISLLSSLISVGLAYMFAMWLRRPFPGSTMLGGLLKAPMMVPGLVAAFLLLNVIAFHGFVNEFLLWTNIISKPLRMQNDSFGTAVIFLQVWKQMPFALLVLIGPVQSIHNEIFDAARDLGASAWTRFRKIVLPLTLTAMQAALILVFIRAAGDFSFQVIVGPREVSSMAQYMYTVQRLYGEWNEAAVVAVVLMTMSLTGALLLAAVSQFLVTGRRR
ncbi:ABC transporter permease [Thalassospira lucentensis]|uniref:ABC transporter permease n=1 Tax=Thalassospira lucentensis TaxID=168935 RepID=UPI00142E62C3|nr:ABC transporter permease subunit [Thalassospira lucentensis]NIZ03576.1 ABC transporter permease subunit [Thalassospira lucentensis]